MSYDPAEFNFGGELLSLLQERGFINSPLPLDKLHTVVKQEDQVFNQYVLSNVTRSFYDTNKRFQDTYLNFLRHLREEVLKYDFFFQVTPTIRFHFPVPFPDRLYSKSGRSLNYHTDTMVGHPFEEINCWLPVTACFGDNTLQLMDLETSLKLLAQFCETIDFDREKYTQDSFLAAMKNDEAFEQYVVEHSPPVALQPGELLLFDPRCIHGGIESKGDFTRVSLDFRIIPTATYGRSAGDYQSRGHTRRKFIRGDVYHQQSIGDLSVT